MPSFIKRPRLRFSLATLLIVVTVLCVWMGRITYLARAQRNAVRVVTEAEGIAIYDFQQNPAGTSPPPNGPPAPQWLVDAIGPEYFQTVAVVGFATNNGRRRNSKAPKVTDEALASLAALPEIEVLELGHNETVTDESLVHLSRIPALKTLYLYRTNVRGLGFAHLEDLAQLENLSLDYSPVNDAGLRHLGRFPSLKHLNINHTSITDAGIAFDNLHQLAHLGLNYTAITDQGLKLLERVKSLTSLEVIGTNVTPEGVARLKTALPQCVVSTSYDLGREEILDPLLFVDHLLDVDTINARLKELNVDGEAWVDAARPERPIVTLRVFQSMLSDESMSPLLQRMPRLEILNFRNVAVGDRFVRKLESNPDLWYVSLKGTRIMDDGLAPLAGLKKLTELDLSETKITDQGLPYLYGLEGLQLLLLNDTRATREGVEELRRRLPACNVSW